MNKKQQPQLPFGCIFIAAIGYVIVLTITILIDGGRPNHEHSTASGMLVLGYTIGVVLVVSKIKFKKTDDWFG